jgi:CRP-like cAMP-binding protein
MSVEYSTIQNRILASLPQEALSGILPHLRRVELPFRAVLSKSNEAIGSLLFPESGYLSMLIMLEEGDAAEVGLIGREGVVGASLALGVDRSPLEVLVQADGHALRLEADVFLRAIDESPALRLQILRYSAAFAMQVTMTAACNGRHRIEQRLARWLLMTSDRLDGAEFQMTHEFLSMMLGVRRAGVTVAAGMLQKAGFIIYERGRVRITDGPGLEAVSCECRDIAITEYERIMGIKNSLNSSFWRHPGTVTDSQ